MKSKLIAVLLLLSVSCGLAYGENAKSIDNALYVAASDIVEKCNANTILVIDDFKSPSPQMTSYIREQMGDLMYEQDGLIKIVTRDKILQQMTESERIYQNSSVIDENTILSVAKRLGAQSVVFGNFEELNNSYMLRVRMLSVKTEEYLFRKTYEFPHSSKTEQLLGRAGLYKKAAVGLSAEANKNSLDFIAPSLGVSFDYAISRKFSVGAKVLASYDSREEKNSLFAMEPMGYIRWYLVSPSGQPVTGLFVEGEIGASLFFVNSSVKSCLNAGAAAGFRQIFNDFYIEPELRFGYPYIFGFGLTGGFRF